MVKETTSVPVAMEPTTGVLVYQLLQRIQSSMTMSLNVYAVPLAKYFVQFVFLFTGVFSTCAAQYVFYQGAGDQKAMLLPLCNYLGMMLVGLIPTMSMNEEKQVQSPQPADRSIQTSGEDAGNEGVVNESEWNQSDVALLHPHASTAMELTARRPNTESDAASDSSTLLSEEDDKASSASSATWSSPSIVQICILISVVLDFAGCIFSNIGLSMAGSGLYQVVYSSVICWSALMSRFVLKKIVSRDEWIGIALVTFGLAFSALGESGGSGKDNYLVLMGCFNTLIGAAFYGGNYVTGEYTLKLPERPQPKELCLKIGTACVGIIAIYQTFFVLPDWHELVTKPVDEAHGSTSNILIALVAYTLSQLAHGLTYFMMLGSSGAVTTGIMQSLRAVCVFAISSVLYCSHQESQCFDTKRGIATLIVVSGVMFYSWAKSQSKKLPPAATVVLPRRKKTKFVAGKNYVV